MQDPLKQGLKLACPIRRAADSIIRMQDPLKQGLKLVFGVVGTGRM